MCTRIPFLFIAKWEKQLIKFFNSGSFWLNYLSELNVKVYDIES